MADKALLAGINNYRSISDLRGCENDVRNIERVITEELGFSSGNIRTLIDRDVTKERIEREWRWLVDDAQPDDRLLFHFSGHGSYTADDDGDEDDGADELLCLYDMDFDDEQTYLLDDDLYQLTERVAEGVALTIILDCCHSGTATRLLLSPDDTRAAESPQKVPLVDVDSSLRRLQRTAGACGVRLRDSGAADAVQHVLSPQDARDERQTVLARFVEPPAHVRRRLHRAGTRSGFHQTRGNRERPMNHTLLAGSKATQTSADAFIESDYHGAFSFYLCQTLREGGERHDLQKLIARVRRVLREEGFSQIPQLEPVDAKEAFLGGRSAIAPHREEGGTAAGSSQVLEDIREELRQIRNVLSERPVREGRAREERRSRALVAVHGICLHRAGFSDSWWEALREHLPAGLRRALQQNRKEVLWSRHVTPRDTRAARDPRLAELERTEAEALRDILEERAAQHAIATRPVQEPDARPERSDRGAERALLGIPGLDCIDDFAKYLLNSAIRDAVQEEFIDVMEPLLRSAMDVEVISHSWGTVVAYEALHRMDRGQLAGRVRNLFTVGAALSIGRVQRRLEPRGGQKPRLVDNWVNLDALGDIVGGRLAGDFEVDGEFLNLHPSGCRVPRLLPVDPSCAHSSYFQQSNIAVNRDVFARFIAAAR